MAQQGMQGKLCLVTGATSGIGKEMARGLAQAGAHVALVARDRAKGEATKQAIIAQTGNTAVDLLVADLSSQQAVRQLAAEVLAAYPRIDVLINNAGLIISKRTLTVDGLESTFAINHLAPFLLTNLLLDRLIASAPARIITTSSTAHLSARINFDDLQAEHGYAAFRVYGQSKLANVLFTRELARRLAGTGVTANCFHPGVVGTNFGRGDGGVMGMVLGLARPFLLTSVQGADTGLYLATSPEVAGATGGYYAKRTVARISAAASNDETARRLWDVSAQLVGLESPAKARV